MKKYEDIIKEDGTIERIEVVNEGELNETPGPPLRFKQIQLKNKIEGFIERVPQNNPVRELALLLLEVTNLDELEEPDDVVDEPDDV